MRISNEDIKQAVKYPPFNKEDDAKDESWNEKKLIARFSDACVINTRGIMKDTHSLSSLFPNLTNSPWLVSTGWCNGFKEMRRDLYESVPETPEDTKSMMYQYASIALTDTQSPEWNYIESVIQDTVIRIIGDAVLDGNWAISKETLLPTMKDHITTMRRLLGPLADHFALQFLRGAKELEATKGLKGDALLTQVGCEMRQICHELDTDKVMAHLRARRPRLKFNDINVVGPRIEANINWLERVEQLAVYALVEDGNSNPQWLSPNMMRNEALGWYIRIDYY